MTTLVYFASKGTATTSRTGREEISRGGWVQANKPGGGVGAEGRRGREVRRRSNKKKTIKNLWRIKASRGGGMSIEETRRQKTLAHGSSLRVWRLGSGPFLK